MFKLSKMYKINQSNVQFDERLRLNPIKINFVIKNQNNRIK